MSKKKKENTLKVNVHVSVFELKDQIVWSPVIAEAILKNDDPSKSWRGYVKVYQSELLIISRSKTYKRKFDISKIRGFMTPIHNHRTIVTGILDEKMLYYILTFDTSQDKDAVLLKLTEIKGPDQTEIHEAINGNSDPYVFDSVDARPIIDDTPEEYADQPHDDEIVVSSMNGTSYASPMIVEHHHNIMNREPPKTPESTVIVHNGMSPIAPKRSNVNHSVPNKIIRSETVQSDAMSNDSDVIPGTWIEDVKYISYEPALGGNVECDDGSVYMYTAHQIVPTSFYGECTESDNDSN